MVGWIILAVLVGLITALMLIPIGADIRYEEGVVRLSAKAAGMKLQLIPKPRKSKQAEQAGKPKKEKKKKEKPAKDEKPSEKSGKKRRSIQLNFDEILDLLKTVLKGFGRFGRKFKVSRFVLHWIAAGWEPYTTARTFSIVNSALSQLAPICSERFQCRDSSVWTDIDFVRDDMFLEFGLTFTIRIGQIIATGLSIGFGVLKILFSSKRRVKQEAREEARALKAWRKEHPEAAAPADEAA